MTKGFAALLLLIAAALPAPAAAVEGEAKIALQNYEGIGYYSGGVGIEERATLPQRFPLKIVLATDKGNLLCYTDVTVSRKGKPVFRGRADNGPWLFVDLPPGTYEIQAVQDGTSRAKKGVKLLAGKPRTVRLRWKTRDVDMGLKD
jgi:hypothetical protein